MEINEYVKEVIHASGVGNLSLTLAKVNELWLSPAKLAYAKLKEDHHISHGIRTVGSVYVNSEWRGVEHTKETLINLRKEHPEISKEEFMDRIKRYAQDYTEKLRLNTEG